MNIFKKILSTIGIIKNVNDKLPYDDCEYELQKISKELVVNELFYVHNEPDPIKDNFMPSEILEHDHINTSEIQMLDEKSGRMVPMSADMVSQRMEHHEPGVFVPGLGFVGGASKQQSPHPQTGTRRPQEQQSQQEQGGTSIGIQQQSNVAVLKALPPTEIILLSDTYHMYVDLAGVRKDSLKMNFNDNVLNISGKRPSMIEEYKNSAKGKSKKNAVLGSTTTVPQFMIGSFSYKYPFKKSVDNTGIKADLNEGILHIILPLIGKGDSVEIPII